MPIFQKKYQFDRYVLEEFLGSGSSAEVWKVSEIGSNVQWALKILAPGSGLDEYGQFVFREEFELWSSIIPIFSRLLQWENFKVNPISSCHCLRKVR